MQGCEYVCVGVHACVPSVQWIKETQIKNESVVSKLNRDHFHLRGEQGSEHTQSEAQRHLHMGREMRLYFFALPLFLSDIPEGCDVLLLRDWQVMSPQPTVSFTSYTKRHNEKHSGNLMCNRKRGEPAKKKKTAKNESKNGEATEERWHISSVEPPGLSSRGYYAMKH